MIKRSSPSKSTWSVQSIVLTAITWAVVALLFFLLFSVSGLAGERPEWYSITTYILEEGAFLGAGLLCFRNWRSNQMVSGRSVWLAIGLAMFSYFVGNLFLAYWEIALNNSPAVSPGDFFFILTYLFLGWGMLQAVLSKQVNLTLVQWAILAVIAVAGVAIAIAFIPSPDEATIESASPAIERVSPASPSALAVSPGASPTAPPIASPEPTPAEEVVGTPDWAIALEAQLTPLASIVVWLYIIGDVILVVMATTLLLAFWGGRFSLSWRCIAAASFCYYIADIWFNYATSYIPDYQTGGLLEVFFIFSGCLFAIGAALEYDLSTRRRSSRRRS
ncbi:MAG: hypothetical protein HC769_15445 [Cyanobacteria bacterium CRU_2_1]|nr:hypothetical protein [Cyanobacteria bacterium RU_5_0]NJR60105.1 hypothetical protein [Cyanobacteria bacterium CRU_2_1]